MTATRRNPCLQSGGKTIHRSKLKQNLTINCVCPKCGTHHRVKMLWSGRGKPKKFCPPCKIFVSSVERVDFCAVPADVHAGIE